MILPITVLALTLILSGCFYTQSDVEEAYEQGVEDAGGNRSKSFDDANFNDGDKDDYERTAQEGGFEEIDKYRNTIEGGNYVFVTPTGSCYHTLECPSLKDTLYVKPYKLGQVPDSYTECSKCHPWQYE